MKLTGIRALSALGGAFLSGCSALAPPPESAPSDRAALEARLSRVESALAELGTRVDRLRQTADAIEQRRERLAAQDRTTLVRVARELRETRKTVTGLRRKLAAQQRSAPVGPRERTAAISGGAGVDHRVVEVALGGLPSGEGERLVRQIPAVVPDAAREILVYVQVATGYVEGGPHRFRVSVRPDGEREAAFYLYANGQPQQGWAYNSDNVWLPMPKNRELILQADGKPFFGDWNSEVRIVGYR